MLIKVQNVFQSIQIKLSYWTNLFPKSYDLGPSARKPRTLSRVIVQGFFPPNNITSLAHLVREPHSESLSTTILSQLYNTQFETVCTKDIFFRILKLNCCELYLILK